MKRSAIAALLFGLMTGCSNAPLECAPNSAERTVCVQCGPTDACTKTERRCVPLCTNHADCASGFCSNGACAVTVCG